MRYARGAGSHKSGLAIPPEDVSVKHIAQPEGSAGCVIVINGQIWHAGGANTGTANRHALFGHYRKRMCMFQGGSPRWFFRLNGLTGLQIDKSN